MHLRVERQIGQLALRVLMFLERRLEDVRAVVESLCRCAVRDAVDFVLRPGHLTNALRTEERMLVLGDEDVSFRELCRDVAVPAGRTAEEDRLGHALAERFQILEVVGRDEELAAVDHFLERPLPAALLIDGEAGIGKTVLWREAIRRATTRGFRALVATPTESERQMPYAALADLVGDAGGDVLDE